MKPTDRLKAAIEAVIASDENVDFAIFELKDAYDEAVSEPTDYPPTCPVCDKLPCNCRKGYK